MSLPEAEEWIEEQSRVRFPKPNDGSYCWLSIKTMVDAKFIGLAGFWFQPDAFGLAHLEIVIHRKQRRNGYGLEAIRGLATYAFENLRAHRVTAHCDDRNVAAICLLGKAGFRRESDCIRDRQVKGQWVNTAGFAMLKEEYKSERVIDKGVTQD